MEVIYIYCPKNTTSRVGINNSSTQNWIKQQKYECGSIISDDELVVYHVAVQLMFCNVQKDTP